MSCWFRQKLKNHSVKLHRRLPCHHRRLRRLREEAANKTMPRAKLNLEEHPLCSLAWHRYHHRNRRKATKAANTRRKDLSPQGRPAKRPHHPVAALTHHHPAAHGERAQQDADPPGRPKPGGPPAMQPPMAPLQTPQQTEGEQGGNQNKGGPQPGGPPVMQPGMAPLPPP